MNKNKTYRYVLNKLKNDPKEIFNILSALHEILSDDDILKYYKEFLDNREKNKKS